MVVGPCVVDEEVPHRKDATDGAGLGPQGGQLIAQVLHLLQQRQLPLAPLHDQEQFRVKLHALWVPGRAGRKRRADGVRRPVSQAALVLSGGPVVAAPPCGGVPAAFV